MSEKETTQKVVTKYDRKVQRRKEEELKEQRQKKINRVIGIAILAVIIIALASIPVRKYIATHSTYITVGGDDITRAEFDYYYNLAKNEYLNTYGSIMSYMGLNVNSDFSTQRYSETMTWQDYFEQLAVDAIKQNKALLAEAEAAGFTYDVSKEYEAFVRSLENGASESGESLGRYYKINFGRYASESSIRPYVEEGYLAAAYYNAVSEQKGASDEEIKAYYEENKAEYDSVDFLLTEIEAQIPEAKTVTDEAGNESTVDPTEEEIQATIQVMGGEDWYDWIQALADAGVVAENAVTLAYSYIGPEVTHPIYKEGSIGQAKKHLYQTSVKMNEDFASLGLKAYISVNKALVTQSSAAIPIVPLYISLLYRVMKDAGLHEGCIEQMDRLFMEKLPNGPETDEEGRIRLDDYEMRPEVQDKISEVWDKVDSESIETLGDIKEYWDEFYHMFGFGYENVDYSEDVEI